MPPYFHNCPTLKGKPPFRPIGFISSHLLSCPTFCFNFLFFLYLRPLQPDLYGSQMCPGKLPEVRHRPKRSLHQSASLRCHSTAVAGSCVCSRVVAWLISLFCCHSQTLEAHVTHCFAETSWDKVIINCAWMHFSDSVSVSPSCSWRLDNYKMGTSAGWTCRKEYWMLGVKLTSL